MLDREYYTRSWGRQSKLWADSQDDYKEIIEGNNNRRQNIRDSEYSGYCRECEDRQCCRWERRCCRRKRVVHRAQLRGLQIQLQSSEVQTLQKGENIVFDTEVSRQSPFIDYDSMTGVITFFKSGNYHIEWNIATEGILSGADTGITFSIVTSDNHSIKSSTPSLMGQLTGSALIEIFTSWHRPVTLKLVNETNGTVALAQLPVKANLTIFHVLE